MSPATPQLKAAAERLLALEAVSSTPAGTGTQLPAVVRVITRLRLRLTTLLGSAGFRALLLRALTLARPEAPELSAVEVAADGTLGGPILAEPHDGQRRFADGDVVLVAHLLGLLVTFVGEAVTLRLVKDAWPKATLDELDLEKG